METSRSRPAGRNTSAIMIYLSLFLAHLTGISICQEIEGTPINFKIAFIGDQGLDENSEAVLNLIKAESADAVIHQGDFDYDDNPAAWDAHISGILGDNFPYFASVGNHDADRFYGSGGYQEFLEARLSRIGVSWDGDLGVKSWAKYKGILILLTGPDVLGSDHSQYIKEMLENDDSIWSVSSWHKNMMNMQVGGKSDETGWEVYEESRRGGAIIATGHEHSYSRTYLMGDFEHQIIASTSDTLILTHDDPETDFDEGRSFAFVSGLGGKSIRDQELSGDWWASIYTSTQNANYGALFGIFNVDSVANHANFYFKDVDGNVVDSFMVVSNVETADSVITAIGYSGEIPSVPQLGQNYPNPFNPSTTIQFRLPYGTDVTIEIYDLNGRVVRQVLKREVSAGGHSISWDGKSDSGHIMATGIYILRFQAGDFVDEKKITLMR